MSSHLTDVPASRAHAAAAAKEPVGNGTSPFCALIFALVLIGLGVIGVQEALVRSNVIDSNSWTKTALTKADDVDATGWMLVVFIVLIILGILVLVSIFKPRTRKTLALKSDTGVYLRTRDLGRIVSRAVKDVDGVTEVKSSSTRRRLNIAVTALTPSTLNSETHSSINSVIEPALSALARPPKVKATIKNQDLA